MVQLNLNLTEHACSKGTTRQAFHFTRAQAACARKISDVKPTVQGSHVCTRRVHNAHVLVKNAHTKF